MFLLVRLEFNITIYLKMKAHSPSHQHSQTKSVFEYLPGPVKIKDGLFMGDEIAARVIEKQFQDIQFIISNKVTHIINTVSKQIPNLWERFGIHYLSVNWTQKEQNIFDKKNNSVNTVFHFVQEAMEQGESVLIHSVNGKSRATAVMVAYLMKKYSWGLTKCFEFISSKKENLEVRNNYMSQLRELQQRMSQVYNLTSQWAASKNDEELILKNTFMNSKIAVPEKVESKFNTSENSKKKRVNFSDKPVIIKATQTLSRNVPKQLGKMPKTPLKSILKGDPNFETASEKNEAEDLQEISANKGKKNSIVNNINGNVVHVTVNNFITSDKKPDSSTKNPSNTRPYSSDQKDREKERKPVVPKKLLAYDTNPLAFKSPYDHKLAARTGSNNKFQKKKDQKQVSKPVNTMYERPQSAKHRSGVQNPSIKGKEQLIITNSNSGNSSSYSKKRYPSNPREQIMYRRR